LRILQAICLPNYDSLVGGHALLDAALKLGGVLLENGNQGVQQTLLDKITDTHANGDGSFGSFADELIPALQKHIRSCVVLLKTHQHAVVDSHHGHGERADEERAAALSAFGFDPRARLHSMLVLLRRLCLGHNRPMQDLLREQPHAPQSFNLVQEVCAVLTTATGTKDELRGIQQQQGHTLQHCMEFLVEVMQGPCPANQELIAEASSGDVARISSSSIRMETDRDGGGRHCVTELKATTMLMVLAMLEGRSESHDVHHLVLNELGAATLRHRFVCMHHSWIEIGHEKKTKQKCCPPFCTNAKNWLLAAVMVLLGACYYLYTHDSGDYEMFLNLINPPSWILAHLIVIGCAGLVVLLAMKAARDHCSHDVHEQARLEKLEEERQSALRVEHDLCFSEGYYLYAVALQLSQCNPHILTKLQPVAGSKLTKGEKDYREAFQFVVKRIRVVEVCWGNSGNIDRIPFVMPEVDEVSEDRKSQLLQQFELGPSKQTDFTKLLPALSDELVHFKSLSDSSFCKSSFTLTISFSFSHHHRQFLQEQFQGIQVGRVFPGVHSQLRSHALPQGAGHDGSGFDRGERHSQYDAVRAHRGV
jgi:hypothetical protein